MLSETVEYPSQPFAFLLRRQLPIRFQSSIRNTLDAEQMIHTLGTKKLQTTPRGLQITILIQQESMRMVERLVSCFIDKYWNSRDMSSTASS